MAETIFKQMYEPSISEDENTEIEADLDVSEVIAQPVQELSFEEKLAALNMTVMRHPLNREIMYKTLVYCQEERMLQEAEAFIGSLPQFELATQNQYFMLKALVKAYGLDQVERDINGERVYEEQKEGLSEDEIDDLVYTISFETTEVGRYFADYNKPSARLIDLLNLDPARSDTYIELLEFVKDAPKTYGQIEQLLRGRTALETIIDGRREIMQPSVFVDKLERSGALIWEEGWTLTGEGKEFLQELVEQKSNERD